MRLSRTVIAALAILALGGSATACGKAADADKPDPIDTPSNGGDKGPGDPSSDALPSPVLERVQTPETSSFVVKKLDGTTYTVTVKTGKLQRATEWLAVGDANTDYDEAMKSSGKLDILGHGCDLDLTAKRHAVVPIRLSIDNTTPEGAGSEPEIAATPYIGDEPLGARHRAVIQQKMQFTNGYDCFRAGGGADPQSMLVATTTSTGGASVPGWVILEDYFPPNRPNGNPAQFENIRLVFESLDDNGEPTFTNAIGLFKEERRPDLAANDGSDYVAGMALDLADLIG